MDDIAELFGGEVEESVYGLDTVFCRVISRHSEVEGLIEDLLGRSNVLVKVDTAV